MKQKILTASLCMLWAPLFLVAGQNSDSQQDQPQKDQMSQTVMECKQAQQALNAAVKQLKTAQENPATASQSLKTISDTVDQAKSHLDTCTQKLESMQSGGSSQGR